MKAPDSASQPRDPNGPVSTPDIGPMGTGKPAQETTSPASQAIESMQVQTVTITPCPSNDPPAGQASPQREVEGSKSEGKPEKAHQTGRKAGRPLVQTDQRILEALIRLDAEGHPWPRIRDLLEPISRKHGGPYPLHVEQVRRLALKAAKILGKKLVKRRDGRPWGYYRQVKKTGGGS